MVKIELELNKLTEVDVKWVSLVKRGANQIPFRVVKSEDIEDDSPGWLGNIFKKFETSKAEITSIIVSKKYDLEKVKDILESEGLSVAHVDSEEEEVHAFKQAEISNDDVLFILADGMWASVTNISKGFRSFLDGTDFAENFKRGAFFPTLRIGSQILVETVENIMFASPDGEGKPKEAVAKAVEDFGKFVNMALSELPEAAFKLASMDMSTCQKSEVNIDSNDTEDDGMDKAEVEKIIVEKRAEFLTTDQEEVLAKVKVVMTGIITHVDKGNAEVKALIDGVATRIDALEKTSKTDTETISAIKTDLAKAQATLKGILPAGSSDNDQATVDISKYDEEQQEAIKKEAIWDGIFTEFDVEEAA